MNTHYIRQKRPRRGERLITPVEGVVYQLTPEDRLVLRGDIVLAVREHCARHPEEGHFTPHQIEVAVNSLAERGFLKEVHGIRLDHWLASW